MQKNQIYTNKKKKILIVGGGGREHALGWKLKQSNNVAKLFFAPGNGGTYSLGKNVDIDSDDIDGLVEFAKKKSIGLTVVGPETPLALGIVDEFNNKELAIFGPTKKAARLESSKAWANKFMKRHNIPCPRFRVFYDYKKALNFIKSFPFPKIVVKASGLASGKGVLLPDTYAEALQSLKQIMLEKKFGSAGDKVVVQERLTGQEVSIIAFSDGNTIVPLLPAQDHKSVFDNDAGPNTGGMGAYAPVPFMSKNLLREIVSKILQPAISGMSKEGCPFKGMLYAGLMITNNGPKVLEYNVRFGDPEAQPQMMLLKSDLLKILVACINGSLSHKLVEFYKGYASCVVLSSVGYPGSFNAGEAVRGLGLKTDKNLEVFHAGTRISKDKREILTNGGRVLGVTGRGKTLEEALSATYSAIGENGVYFSRMHYRKDIGRRVLDKRVIKLAILISGSGTTMESIINACNNGTLRGVRIVGVISSAKDAKGLAKANKLGVNTKVVDPKSYKSTDEFSNAMLKILDLWKPDLISQNGWLPKTPKEVISKYKGKIINQHPAPLDPDNRGVDGVNLDFGGKDMHGIVPIAATCYFRKLVLGNQKPWHAKRKITAESTVHLVTEQYDKGPVVKQNTLEILESDTPESIQKKLLPIEHKTVISAISDFAKNNLTIQKRIKPLVRHGEEQYLNEAKRRAINKYILKKPHKQSR